MKTSERDTTQEFIEWVEEIGPAKVMALIAQACDVEADTAPSDALAAEWQREIAVAEKLAKRFARVQERCHAHRRWLEADPSRCIQGAFIGMETTYLDGEWPESHGDRFRIETVFKRVDGREERVAITDNDDLRVRGGVSACDTVEVRAIRSDGRSSCVSSEACALDFECFAALREPAR